MLCEVYYHEERHCDAVQVMQTVMPRFQSCSGRSIVAAAEDAAI